MQLLMMLCQNFGNNHCKSGICKGSISNGAAKVSAKQLQKNPQVQLPKRLQRESKDLIRKLRVLLPQLSLPLLLLCRPAETAR